MTELADIRDLISDEEMIRKAQLPAGCYCPLCSHKVKVYPRRFNVGMAQTMVFMYRFGRDWFNIGLFMKGVRDCHVADYTKMILWGLMEKHPGKSEDGNSCGLYRITPKGIDFVEGWIDIPSRAYEYLSNVLAFDSEEISIAEALAGSKFNYNELMSMRIPDGLID